MRWQYSISSRKALGVQTVKMDAEAPRCQVSRVPLHLVLRHMINGPRPFLVMRCPPGFGTVLMILNQMLQRRNRALDIKRPAFVRDHQIDDAPLRYLTASSSRTVLGDGSELNSRSRASRTATHDQCFTLVRIKSRWSIVSAGGGTVAGRENALRGAAR